MIGATICVLWGLQSQRDPFLHPFLHSLLARGKRLRVRLHFLTLCLSLRHDGTREPDEETSGFTQGS